MEIVGDIGAGHTLGRYELLIPIASGGMASVWAARLKGPRGFQKIVAVKLMLAELVDDVHFEKMFLDEAELASRIKHPNVVEIVDLGEQDGVLYQVMEWVDGEPLNMLIREMRDKGAVPVPLALRIVAQACAGLHAAHDLADADGKTVGLVHRDVSPQNLLCSYEGMLKVVDFGVAKAASNRQQTTVGQMKGKAPYMAPEQALGERVDRRTDVFALGIVLFQLTTGRHPFRAENDLATLRRIVGKDPAPRARQFAPALPTPVDEIIAKALSKDRESRFASMHEMMLAAEAAMPRGKVASSEDVGQFLKKHLGHRGEKRRAAIKNAVRVADERSLRKAGEVATRRAASAVATPIPHSGPGSIGDGPDSARSQPRSDERSYPSVTTGPDPLERELQAAAVKRQSRSSVVGALVVVCLLAVGVVGLYLLEASSRAVP